MSDDQILRIALTGVGVGLLAWLIPILKERRAAKRRSRPDEWDGSLDRRPPRPDTSKTGSEKRGS